jgi:hypothetical protein
MHIEIIGTSISRGFGYFGGMFEAGVVVIGLWDVSKISRWYYA